MPDMFEELPGDKVTFEVMLKDPYYRDADTDEVTPMVEHMGWSQVMLMRDPINCEHTDTVCYACADSWAEDHHVRIKDDGELVFLSEGAPND